MSICGHAERRLCGHTLETSMKYLCLIYYDEHKLDALSSSEFDALVREAVDYDERMRESGHYVTSNALQPTPTATSLRDRAAACRSRTARSPRRRSNSADSS
jgi:hypothetical protein